MPVLKSVLTIMILGIMSFSSVSQETEAEQPAPPAEPTPPAEPALPAESAPRQPDTRTLDEIFIPSQEVGADEEVIFPVNI